MRDMVPELPPSDRTVSAEEYRLGPGDVLLGHIVAPVVQTHRLVVSVTGELVIPRFGLLSVQGMSLAQARRSVEQLVQQRHPEARVELNLLVPRRVVVTVTGYVRAPGMYVLPASVRVSTAIRIALQSGQSSVSAGQRLSLPGASSRQEVESYEWESSAIPPLPSYCTRNVLLRFADGRTQTADIERGRAMGDLTADPLVSEGLEIFVPPPPPEGYPTVSIGGAVGRMLRVAYRAGDKVSFVLRLAGGLRPEAEPVVFVHAPGQPPQRIELDTVGNPVKDLDLVPGASLLVPQRPTPGATRLGIVRVVGSVLHPGAYVIEPGRTRLREVIERAGGLAPNAALAQAYIQRVPAPWLLASDPRIPAEVGLYSRFLYSDLRLEDTVRYALDMRLQRSLVVCDFVALFQHGDTRQDVPLEDGDLIVVPTASEGIYLWGQVRLPGYVPFVPGKTVEWYVQQAGGYSVGADPKRVRVLRGPTRNWLLPEQAGAVQPGDEIYVPRRLDVPAWAQQQAELQFYTVLVGAVSTLTFVVTTIFNLLRR